MRLFLLWLILMLASPCGLAIDAARGLHQLQHSSWTARDGAPDDISVMTQGHDGFLWLGASTGLYLDMGAGAGVVVLGNGDAFQGADETRTAALGDLIDKLLSTARRP